MVNTGCFYAANNVRTKNFFSSMVLRGIDELFDADSLQAVMSAMLSEHASQFGLRVKTWWRENEMLPSKLQDRFYFSVLLFLTNFLATHLQTWTGLAVSCTSANSSSRWVAGTFRMRVPM